MTKQEFLNGDKFKLGNFKFQFKPNMDENYKEPGYLVLVIANTVIGHEANIDTLDEEGISYYTHVMGQIVRGYVRFSDMKKIVDFELHKEEVVDKSYPEEIHEEFLN